MVNRFLSLFSRANLEPKDSALKNCISTISTEHSRIAYCSGAIEESRFPSAISLLVLFSTNRLSNGISEFISDFDKTTISVSRSRQSSQDAIIFEIAAYCHAYLEHCGERPREYAGEELDEDSLYSNALSYSCALTIDIIIEMMVPQTPKEAMRNRYFEYSLAFGRGLEKAMCELEWKLQWAIVNGVPQKGNDGTVPLDTHAVIAAKFASGIGHQTLLPGLVESVRRLHSHGPELLKEWREQHGDPV